MKKLPDKKIILEDGQEYYGYSFGSDTVRMLLDVLEETTLKISAIDAK